MKRIITILYMAMLCTITDAQSSATAQSIATSHNIATAHSSVTDNGTSTAHSSAPQAMTHGHDSISLAEALKLIDQSQTDKRIHFVYDDLERLRVKRPDKKAKSTYEAVKKLCKTLPVSVKAKGRNIFVEADKQEARTVNLTGEVEDEFLGIPLTDAKVSIHNPDSSVLIDSLKIVHMLDNHTRRVMAAQFYATIKAERPAYLVHAQLEGYGDVWQHVSVANSKASDVCVPKLRMRKMRTISLDDVVVTATRIKMFWRGDTLIYDATAFKLPDGSMLDDLIRQMPGVSINEHGEIFVNGRKVDEMLLGSRSFMRGNKRILMENLPYYTVKQLKVYDKQSDRSAALGYDIDPKRYVMDVILKEEYNRTYIANMEAAAGTHDRLLARGFLLGFTDRWRYSLMGNANNVNESRHIGKAGHWAPASMPQSMTTTHSVAGEIDYTSKGGKAQETLDVDYCATATDKDMRRRHEQFLNGTTPTSLTDASSHSGSHKLRLHNTLTLTAKGYMRAEANLEHQKTDGHTSTLFDQWGDSLTASMRTVGVSEGTSWQADAELQGNVKVGRGQHSIGYQAKATYASSQSQHASRYTTQQFATPATSLRHNTGDIDNTDMQACLKASYTHSFTQSLRGEIGNTVSYSAQDCHDFLYHPDTLTLASQLDALTAITDWSNSYDSRLNSLEDKISLKIAKKGKYKPFDNKPILADYSKWSLGLTLPIRHQTLDYKRGTLDTLATRVNVLLNAEGQYHIMSKGYKHDMTIYAHYDQGTVSLTDLITYRDDSQPLIVKLGNPTLKGTSSARIRILYLDKNRKGSHQQNITLNATFRYNIRDVAQSVAYDPMSGIYTYKPMNVSGAYNLHQRFYITRNIDKGRRWSWQSETELSFDHNIDHSMFAGEVMSHKNTVNTLTLGDYAHVQYNKEGLSLRAIASVKWRHSEGRMSDFSSLNAIDYRYGMSARYTLPRVKTTLSADANMHSRRGYGAASLNTDNFVLNASLSQPFIKGRLVARIEAFDLLHQLSSTQYEVNAQGRTETWYRSLPHYIMRTSFTTATRLPRAKSGRRSGSASSPHS